MGPIKVGIIGCGRIADLHAPGYLRSSDARIEAVCDARGETAERRAREWNAPKVYVDYRELLSDPDIDLVEIVVPHRLHKEMCVAACRAGKHVSVQKPMAMTAAECDEMIAAAAKAGVKLRVFENFVFYPPYVKAKELIDEGAIGEPLSVRIRLGGAGKGGWPVPLSSWLWRLDVAACGGGPNIFDDGYHKFSIAIHFLGAVERVNAWIDRSFGIIDAPAMISWRHKTGGRIGLLDSTLSPHMTVKSKYYAVDERVEIVGSEGALYAARCTAALLDEPPLALIRDGQTRTFDGLRCDWLDSFIDSTEHFIRCVRGENAPSLSGERGKEVLQFALAALTSAREGRTARPDEME